MSDKRPTALIILDGFGLSDFPDGDATKQAKTPTIDRLYATAPHAKLSASGEDVGLVAGQMGDSNVGHLNIGAGRIVYQDVARITKAARDGELQENPALTEAMDAAKAKGTALHFMGLVSPGGVHSHTDHLYALLQMAKDRGLEKVYIHAFLDGRDVPPTSGKGYIEDLEAKIREIGVGEIAMVSGRYYAMDRDKRWERVELAYQAMTMGEGRKAANAAEAVQYAYDHDENDEFVIPTVIEKNGQPTARISSGDSVIFFNFRSDRARQITWALVNDDFGDFQRPQGKLDLHYVCMTQYDINVQAPIAFAQQDLKNTLGEYLGSLGKTQLRIAETEKYAHVTFFFNGGVEEPFAGEDREMVPSPKVATYDLQPEMSAPEVTKRVVAAIKSGKYDCIVLNYANCDMVGHTGDIGAAIKAVETVDAGLGQVLEALQAQGGQALITADHGNAEQMINPETKEVHTAHTSNLVPIWLFNADGQTIKDGILADLSPSLLELMGLEKPTEMTGTSILQK